MRFALTFGLFALLGCSRNPAPAPTPVTPTPQASAEAPAATAAPPAAAPPAAAPAAEASLTVQSPATTTLLAQGAAAPSFQAVTHDGQRVESNGAARARVLVVYFYPRDETPGCTREACSFRDAFRAYTDAGADLVGVSTDTAESHRGFAAHHTLPFGLIADPQGRLAGAFGLDASGGVAPRTTFVIGRDGHIARVFQNVQVTGHSDEVLAAVRAAH